MSRALWLALWALAAASARADEGWVGGRLAFQQGTSPISLKQIKDALRGDPLKLELRCGATTIAAALRDDGSFVARGPPGTYRLEYLMIGERAEFFAPQQVEIRRNQLVCAGTIILHVRSPESLGTNSGSQVTVADNCPEVVPRLRQMASGAQEAVTVVATAGPEHEHDEVSIIDDYLVPLRAEFAAAPASTSWWYVLGASYSVYHWGVLTQEDHLALTVEGGLVMSNSPVTQPPGYEGTISLRYKPFGIAELGPIAGFRASPPNIPGGPVLGGMLYLGFTGIGVTVRGELLPAPALILGLSVSPVFVLGALL